MAKDYTEGWQEGYKAALAAIVPARAAQSPALWALRHRVASVLYEVAPSGTAAWSELSDQRKKAWLFDADLVIPVVIEAVCRVIDQRDTDKGGSYLIRRESIPDVIRGLFLGSDIQDPDEWERPSGWSDAFTTATLTAAINPTLKE